MRKFPRESKAKLRSFYPRNLLLHRPPRGINPHHRRGEEQRVDAIQHAPVAGKNRAGIFYARAALDERLDQIASWARNEPLIP